MPTSASVRHVGLPGIDVTGDSAACAYSGEPIVSVFCGGARSSAVYTPVVP